jgi:hypothetical protein
MNRNRAFGIGCLVSLSLIVGSVGCSVDLTDLESPASSFTKASIVDQIPTGIHDGQSWTMLKAEVKSDYFDEDRLTIRLFTEEIETCGFSSSSEKPYLLFSVKKAVGEYPLKMSFGEDGQTVTFVTPPATNTIATQGIVVIEELTAEKLTMGIVAQAGDGDVVNGRFTVDLCDSSI